MEIKEFQELVIQVEKDIKNKTISKTKYNEIAAKISQKIELDTLKKLIHGLEFNNKFGGLTGTEIMKALREKIKELEGKK